LSAGNKDYLKLGQVLGADGLLLLDIVNEGTNQSLNIRLMAVKPGVVLVAEKFLWTGKNPTEWASSFTKHLDLFLPKLTVLVKDAIPISVVNLRSAISSADGLETERQLKLLTIQRLSREPQLFVLERQQMQLLGEEKELKLDDSAFWNGSILLEGVVDQNGFSQETVTINARLTPPKGGSLMLLEVRGARTNLAEVINQLAVKVNTALQVSSTVTEWNAVDEAQQFFEEANWALRWGVFVEAQVAAESAWALGRRNSETATLRLRAYSESVSLQSPIDSGYSENYFSKRISIPAIPYPERFRPLTRATELFSQDGRFLLGSNQNWSREHFLIALQLLHRTVGLLESYYYAAEARDAHQEELSALRENARRMLATLDANPPPSADPQRHWISIRQDYDWLKWEEGGIFFDRPEEALPMFRKIIESGYQPEHLPRLVGWTWEDRKRVPDLMRHFIADLRASTNPAVRLDSLYLALLKAPMDEQHSVQSCEQELITAIWDNRQLLFESDDQAALLERTEDVLRAKYDDQDYNQPYIHEPFASFKHRLRLDFLEHATTTNREIFYALFPNSNRQMETEAQAKELLPLALNYQERSHLTRVLDWQIEKLRQKANLAVPVANVPEKTVPAADMLEAKFIAWKLPGPGIETGRTPHFSGMIFRNGKLWVRVRYTLSDRGWPESGTVPTTYLAVNPQSGAEEEIPFPAKLGEPDAGFEVSPDSLFVSAHGQVYRFKFLEKIWEEISAPVEGGSQFVWLKGNLFASRSDGLLQINPDSKAVEILVSSRRQPAINDIDPLWTGQTRIFLLSDGRLGALSEDRCFSFDPVAKIWNSQVSPMAGTNNFFSSWTRFTSASGAQRFLTGPLAHWYLLGYWHDGHAPESLLMETAPWKMPAHPREKLLQPMRWDWPENFPLEPSSILADEQALWVLCPRKTYQNQMFPQAREPVKFSDARQATLFHFDSESRAPQSVPIHFESNSKIVIPIVNGQPVDMLSPMAGGYLGIQERIVSHEGNTVFWLKTPDGFIFGAPKYCGHWLIPNAALQTKLDAQRALLRQQSKTTNAVELSKP